MRPFQIQAFTLHGNRSNFLLFLADLRIFWVYSILFLKISFFGMSNLLFLFPLRSPLSKSLLSALRSPLYAHIQVSSVRTSCWAQLSMTYNLEFKHGRYRYECDDTLNIPGASRRQIVNALVPSGTTTLRSVCRTGQDQIVSFLLVGFKGAADRQILQSLPQNLSINDEQDTHVERLSCITFDALELLRIQVRECLSPHTLQHGSADPACTPAQQCLIRGRYSVGHLTGSTTSTLGCSVINRRH
jgi:hypothetical protein